MDNEEEVLFYTSVKQTEEQVEAGRLDLWFSRRGLSVCLLKDVEPIVLDMLGRNLRMYAREYGVKGDK